MKVAFLDGAGHFLEKVTDQIPRIGERICIFNKIKPPVVVDVLWYPDHESLKGFDVVVLVE